MSQRRQTWGRAENCAEVVAPQITAQIIDPQPRSFCFSHTERFPHATTHSSGWKYPVETGQKSCAAWACHERLYKHAVTCGGLWEFCDYPNALSRCKSRVPVFLWSTSASIIGRGSKTFEHFLTLWWYRSQALLEIIGQISQFTILLKWHNFSDWLLCFMVGLHL